MAAFIGSVAAIQVVLFVVLTLPRVLEEARRLDAYFLVATAVGPRAFKLLLDAFITVHLLRGTRWIRTVAIVRAGLAVVGALAPLLMIFNMNSGPLRTLEPQFIAVGISAVIYASVVLLLAIGQPRPLRIILSTILIAVYAGHWMLGIFGLF